MLCTCSHPNVKFSLVKFYKSILRFFGQRINFKVFLIYLLIYSLTFGVVAPYILSSWAYSAYFNEDYFSEVAEGLLKESNRQRLEKAQQYFRHLDANASLDFHQKQLKQGSLDILVIVKTIDRSVFHNNPKMGYLTQTAAKLDQEIRSATRDGHLNAGLVVCNADPWPTRHEEAVYLAGYYPAITFEPKARSVEVREAEKQDYARCLHSVSDVPARYVLLVEDDAEPYDGMLQELGRIVRTKLETRMERGERIPGTPNWAFLKLYYPERWAGYGKCAEHIAELCGIGCCAGATFAAVAFFRMPRSRAVWAHFFLGAAYGVILAVLVGRQHLLQLRRLIPGLVTVGTAPYCCTPATLYPRHMVEQIVRFLATVTCKSDYGVDLALDDFVSNCSLRRYFVEPNLFHHRGIYSTLTKPKGMVEFLFDA